jgi:hypothetical protein
MAGSLAVLDLGEGGFGLGWVDCFGARLSVVGSAWLGQVVGR